MDTQYAWLQELDKRTLMPKFTPECSGGDEPLRDGVNRVKKFVSPPHKSCRHASLMLCARQYAASFCANHEDLKTTFYKYTTFDPDKEGAKSFSFSLDWKKENGDKKCDFDCQYIFSQFWDTPECINDKGMQKNGKIQSDCGVATYYGHQNVSPLK
jgi:hypothetical protein